MGGNNGSVCRKHEGCCGIKSELLLLSLLRASPLGFLILPVRMCTFVFVHGNVDVDDIDG